MHPTVARTQLFRAYPLRAYGYFDGGGSPISTTYCFNISSITDLGAGHYTLNFSSVPSGYAATTFSADIGGWTTGRVQVAGSGTQLRIWNSSGTSADGQIYFMSAI